MHGWGHVCGVWAPHQVDRAGRIESFNSFRCDAGPLDEFGEWDGEEIIFTLQVTYDYALPDVFICVLSVCLLIADS